MAVLERWLEQGCHGSMHYMEETRSRLCRADPRQLLPECRSILVLAAPYSKPDAAGAADTHSPGEGPRGRVAAYAWGRDYHDVLPARMQQIVQFIEERVGERVANRCFTDSAPIMERDLAQRAGLGWIGKNTCLINPRRGSYFLLAEILLGLELSPDVPMRTDHCGSCRRCIDACPTDCILPDRTIDARKCISHLTIELRETIPAEVRPAIGNWVFGCDICQMVCPWNRFAPSDGDEAFAPVEERRAPLLLEELRMPPQLFSSRYQTTALSRAKYDGYRRNLAVAIGNTADRQAVPVLADVAAQASPMVAEHATWAASQIAQRQDGHA